MYLLGFDIGSSSVKVSMVEAETGKLIGSSFQPKKEMTIHAPKAGWAEQDPELSWWANLKLALSDVLNESNVDKSDIKSIGISYQMHGLVAVDKNREVVRPSIIWCDSRAVEIGNAAFQEIGEEKCLEYLLNSPGNFTASKLAWIKKNESAVYEKIDKIMLPGDYIAMKLTGELNTTISGLSEGIFWNFKENNRADFLLEHYGFEKSFIPEIVPTFSEQGKLAPAIAKELGLSENTAVTYRAGDQPNNAFSLNVLSPGEIAATAGTSGVVYGVSEEIKYDPQSRVNTFAHVNQTESLNRLGVLLCVNGTGILNAWLKQNMASDLSYEEINNLASSVAIGSNGVSVLPFGNGAERVLGNLEIGSIIKNINFNTHNRAHVLRAAQEGIVFSFKYGIDIMEGIGIKPSVIRAGNANMFLSPIFRDTLAGVTGSSIELYDTDGAQGAARASGVGSGYYKSFEDAFTSLEKIKVIEPAKENEEQYSDAYQKWLNVLNKEL